MYTFNICPWIFAAQSHKLDLERRALAALGAAARAEDKYGVAQLGAPGLAEVAASLASAALALQAYAKVAAAPRSGRGCAAGVLLGAHGGTHA